MGKSQLNKELTPEQVAELVAFMKALNGEIPEYAKLIPAAFNAAS
jgi:cytochrome c peroxidase